MTVGELAAKLQALPQDAQVGYSVAGPQGFYALDRDRVVYWCRPGVRDHPEADHFIFTDDEAAGSEIVVFVT